MKDLAELNIPKEYITFFYKLLSKRLLIPTNLPKNIEEKETYIGLAQGSGVSPAFWAIYTRFIDSLIGSGVQVLQFADDLVLFVKSKTIAEGIKVLEREVNALSKKLQEKNLLLVPTNVS